MRKISLFLTILAISQVAWTRINYETIKSCMDMPSGPSLPQGFLSFDVPGFTGSQKVNPSRALRSSYRQARRDNPQFIAPVPGTERPQNYLTLFNDREGTTKRGLMILTADSPQFCVIPFPRLRAVQSKPRSMNFILSDGRKAYSEVSPMVSTYSPPSTNQLNRFEQHPGKLIHRHSINSGGRIYVHQVQCEEVDLDHWKSQARFIRQVATSIRRTQEKLKIQGDITEVTLEGASRSKVGSLNHLRGCLNSSKDLEAEYKKILAEEERIECLRSNECAQGLQPATSS